MAIPKEPAELEARLLNAKETFGAIAQALSDVEADLRAGTRPIATVNLIRRVATAAHAEVLS